MEVYVVGSPVRSVTGLYRLLDKQLRSLVRGMIPESLYCYADHIDNPVCFTGPRRGHGGDVRTWVLWRCQVGWKYHTENASFCPGGFTLCLRDRAEMHGNAPAFETFYIVKPGKEPMYLVRSVDYDVLWYIPEYSQCYQFWERAREREQAETVKSLRHEAWAPLLDTGTWLPHQSRYEDDSQWVTVDTDDIATQGLSRFLYRCIPRPWCYEQTLQLVWIAEWSEVSLHGSMKKATTLAECMDAESLVDWWWVCFVAEVSVVVKKLLEVCPSPGAVASSSHSPCDLPFMELDGEATAKMKAREPPRTLFSCRGSGADSVVELYLGAGEWRSLPGVTVDDNCFREWSSESRRYESKLGHVLLLLWFVDGGFRVPTIHYIAKVDSHVRRCNFEVPLFVRAAVDANIFVHAKVGSWVRKDVRLYEQLRDRDRALEYAQNFAGQVGLRREDRVFRGEDSVCAGGPGVGKTFGKILGMAAQRTRDGIPCVITSNLGHNRNQIVELLQRKLSPDVFERCVRVEGERNLDALARSRTLEVLVGKASASRLESHQRRWRLALEKDLPVCRVDVLFGFLWCAAVRSKEREDVGRGVFSSEAVKAYRVIVECILSFIPEAEERKSPEAEAGKRNKRERTGMVEASSSTAEAEGWRGNKRRRGGVVEASSSTAEAEEKKRKRPRGREMLVESQRNKRMRRDVVEDTPRLSGLWDSREKALRDLAQGRSQLEEKVKKLRVGCIARSSTIVATMDALTKPASLDKLAELCCDGRFLELIVIEEAGRVLKYSADMFLFLLRAHIRKETKITLCGDPCQIEYALDLSERCKARFGNSGVSTSVLADVMQGLVRRGVDDDGLLDTDFMEKVAASFDFVNRTLCSMRCRARVCGLVTELAPHCLPGAVEFWSTPVPSIDSVAPLWAPWLGSWGRE